MSRNWRRAGLGLAGLVVSLLLQAAPAMADVTVEVEFAAPRAVPADVSALAGGAPVAVVGRKGVRLTLRTTEDGYQALLADPDLLTVRRLGGHPAEAPSPAPAERLFTLRLVTAGGLTGEGVPAGSPAAGRATARLLGTATTTDATPSAADRLGPGTLLVRGLAADGSVVSERVVTDPRLVRFELGGRVGELGGGREFLRAEATLAVSLPETRRIARLAILAPPAAGASNPRALATVALP